MRTEARDGAHRRIASYVAIVALAMALTALADAATRLAYSEVALSARVEEVVGNSEKATTRHPVRVVLHSPYGK